MLPMEMNLLYSTGSTRPAPSIRMVLARAPLWEMKVMPLGWPKDEKGTPVSTKVVSTRLRLSMTPMQLGPTTRVALFPHVADRHKAGLPRVGGSAHHGDAVRLE